MELQQKKLTEEISLLCYHFPGINWNEAWMMTSQERSIVVRKLEDILKQQADSLKNRR